jgi:hypothetical protein
LRALEGRKTEGAGQRAGAASDGQGGDGRGGTRDERGRHSGAGVVSGTGTGKSEEVDIQERRTMSGGTKAICTIDLNVFLSCGARTSASVL